MYTLLYTCNYIDVWWCMFIWFVYKCALFLVITTYVLWHFLAYLHCFFQGETAASGGKPSVVLEGQYSVKEAPDTDPKRSKMRFSGMKIIKVYIWVFPKIGVVKPPKWMVYNGKPYFFNGWFGGTTIFWKHPFVQWTKSCHSQWLTGG